MAQFEQTGDDYRLLTPENVELRYDIAGVGSRLAAAMVDYMVLFAGLMALFLGAGFSAGLITQLDWFRSVPDRLIGVLAISATILLGFLAWWGYFVLFEMLWNGQTPGKRMLGLRVVRAGGQSVSITASLIRNVLRAIDTFLLLGVAVMVVDRLSRRLGDFAAGTLVVREPRPLGRSALQAVPIPEVSAERLAAFPNGHRLTMAHYTLLREFFARRTRLPRDQAWSLAGQLAGDFARALEVPPSEIGDPILFLATAARVFEGQHRYYDAP